MSCVQTAQVSERLIQAFGPYLGNDRLNLGCAKNALSGFINLDMDSRSHADVTHDLELTPLSFAANSFDCVLASHVFEHIENIFPLMVDLHRIMRPGGFLIAVTPHGASDDAWDCPHHKRMFSQNTWHYFTQRLYETRNHAGYGAYQGESIANWRIENINLVPYPKFANDPDLEFKLAHYRNVIQEVHAVLKAVKE